MIKVMESSQLHRQCNQGWSETSVDPLRLHVHVRWVVIRFAYYHCREWRCSWSSADRRCSNYIWVIGEFNAGLWFDLPIIARSDGAPAECVWLDKWRQCWGRVSGHVWHTLRLRWRVNMTWLQIIVNYQNVRVNATYGHVRNRTNG